MSRFLRPVALSLCLIVGSTIAVAQTKHEWNDNENTSWHQYLKERHKKDHEWAQANKREQKDYWKWRDAHPDAH